jgi:amino acid transporter
MAVDHQQTSIEQGPGLRRNLKLWHVIGLSIGLMAPSMAISINPQGAIAAVGRAIPLSFTIALVGALLVAYGFSRLSQHFHHSGSVLGLVGATLGARAGVVAAWCLAGTYVLFAFLTAVTAGIYGTLFLQAVGIIHSDPSWLAYLLGAVTVIVAGGLAAVPTDRATDVILSFEGATIALIIIAAAVVLVKLLGHSGPGHLGVTMSVFTPAKGTTTSNVFLGVVFGFLSFGGFEAAAALGGEASRPRRDIPRAIIATVAIIGVFYVVISAIEMMGFGTSKAGLDNFANSPALLGTLGQTYVANWFGDLIIAGTVISAFGCCMASCVGASRLIYSFARDGLRGDHPVARVSPRYGTPVVAVGVVAVAELVLEIMLGGVVGAKPLTVFAWSGTISTFLILIAYGMVTVGAAAFLFVRPILRHEPMKAPAAEIVLPVAGVALLIYTIYRNVVPYPTGSSAWLPVAAGVWLLVAVLAVLVAPSFSRRLGERLVTDEGFEVADVADVAEPGAPGAPGESLRRPATA